MFFVLIIIYFSSTLYFSDPEIKTLLEPYKQALHTKVHEVVGYANENFVDKQCGAGECALGDLAADAYINAVSIKVIDKNTELAMEGLCGLHKSLNTKSSVLISFQMGTVIINRKKIMKLIRNHFKYSPFCTFWFYIYWVFKPCLVC